MWQDIQQSHKQHLPKFKSLEINKKFKFQVEINNNEGNHDDYIFSWISLCGPVGAVECFFVSILLFVCLFIWQVVCLFVYLVGCLFVCIGFCFLFITFSPLFLLCRRCRLCDGSLYLFVSIVICFFFVLFSLCGKAGGAAGAVGV